jgi:Cu/Ag efflux pump CusA
MPVDVFPELNAPTVVVLTEAGGFAADEVEQYVTFPIESAVNGLPGVRRVRSSSAMGLSLVWVEFDWGTDIYRARQVVSEGMAAVLEQLPEQVHTEIAPITGITGEIMLMSLSSPDGRVVAAGTARLRRVRAAPAPARRRGRGAGGGDRRRAARVPGERAARCAALYGLTVEDVTRAAAEAHSTASAGYLANVQGVEIPLRQAARVRSEQDIRDTVLKYVDGSPVTIGQVADVVLGPAPPRGTGGSKGIPRWWLA